MNSVSGIYVILNEKNGKIYIGQAQNIKRRWAEHRSALNQGKHSNRHLQAAWNKYDVKVFRFKVLEHCAIEQLNEREQSYLDIYIPKGICYNIATDVLSNGRGIPRSEETKRKISAGHLGKKHAPMSDEARQNIVKSLTGRKHSEETKRKQSEAAKRRPPPSAETRQKLSDANKRRPPVSQETCRKISEAAKLRNKLKRISSDDINQ